MEQSIMTSAKREYKQADSLARKMNIRSACCWGTMEDRHKIRTALSSGYPDVYRAVFSVYWRTSHTPEQIKYLFALHRLSEIEYQHWRDLQNEYGIYSSIAESAHTVWETLSDAYFDECKSNNGPLSFAESINYNGLLGRSYDQFFGLKD